MMLLGWRCKVDTIEDLQCKIQQTRSTFADRIKPSSSASGAGFVETQMLNV
jgi:hypothetical protein